MAGPKAKIPAEEDESPKVKRPRIAADSEADGKSGEDSSDTADASHSASLPHLTADLWAIVMPFLPYGDNLQCTAVSRSFLQDVAPRIKEITVLSSKEMKVQQARRFGCVENVKVACLYHRRRIMHVGDRYGEYDEAEDEDEDELNVEIDRVTASLVVPFLSAFPSLKAASLGRYDDFGDFVRYDNDDADSSDVSEEVEEALLTIQWLLCGAYRSELIPSDAVIDGADVACGNVMWTAPPDQYCSECVNYTECFPLKVAAFKICWSCFPIGKGIDIILARPGGKEYLTSSEFFLSTCFRRRGNSKQVLSALKDRDLLPNNVSRQEVMKYLDTNKRMYSIISYIKEDIDTWKRYGVPVECNDFAKIGNKYVLRQGTEIF